MDATRGIVYKAPAATGAIELTWPMAAVAVAYIVGQTVVDTWGE